jgi:hypothetical protein
MKMYLLSALLFVVGAAAVASEKKEMSREEVLAVNFLLQCPKEVAQLSKPGNWIQSGAIFSDRTVLEGRSYNFIKGGTWARPAEPVATLVVSRVRRPNPPADARNFTIKCEVVPAQ